MSFLAKLFINDEERNILNASQVYSRHADVNGRPTSKPVGEQLHFTIESTRDDSFFYENMLSPTDKCSGAIIFYKRDGLSTLFKMEFANAQILALSEAFDAIGEMPLHMNISIGWGIMKTRDLVHQESWNLNNPFIEIEETFVSEKEEEGQILDIYFENSDREKITKLRKNKKVFLVIKTNDMIGKRIDIDLTEDAFNFEYENQILENDQLLNHQVTSDLMKLELITRKQN